MRPEHYRRARWSLIAPLAGVAAAVVLVGAFLWFDARTPVASDLPAQEPDFSEMTGTDLARALGLKPHLDGITHGCEATGYGQVAYCLDGVSDDPLETRILALQIQGYERNDALEQFARLQLQIADVIGGSGNTHQWAEAIAPFREQQDALKSDLVYVAPDIRGLTGEAIGDELGLAPMTVSEQPGCWAFAEYVNGRGFCFEDLTRGDKLASYILGRQINGDPPNDTEADYLAAVLAWRTLNDQPLAQDPEREAELWGQMVDLRAQLTEHRPARPSNPTG